MSTRIFENNNNFNSPPRHFETITISVSKRHAATRGLSIDTIDNINITKNITYHFLDHAIQCDHCALEVKKALEKGQGDQYDSIHTS